ncbi:hypothetical protein D9Q98_002474 [Chlorella vulgaris]|uniref:C2 NT-type domain-containing protein n=1 Tax=Chlorella vulgaris TaxID=3077 RepID=A0A9D4TTE6_CHLVU|nr:hypothetical protein D9Q98_002474 [Chlorella vulgaris]
MAALAAVKSFKRLAGSRQQGLTYEVEVVAQHAAELPLPPGSQAIFVLKRRHRLCVTEAAEVDGGGGVEWDTRCTQTATLFKEGGGGAAASWRPKQFVFKVQAVREGGTRGGGGGQQGGEAVTVAKAALDLSQFCGPEPFGPKQLVVPLRPSGVLCVSVRTQWLQHFDREADSLTDISHLSLAQSALTSIVGGSTAPLPLSAAEAAQAEQDLSGFDSSSTAAAAAASAASAAAYGQQHDGGGGAASSSSSSGIRAVYLPGGAAAAAATPALRAKRRPPMLRLPAALRGGAAASEKAAQQAQQAQQQQAQQAGFQFAGAASQGSEAATAAAEAGAGGEAEAEAATPTLFVATGRLPGEGRRGQLFAGQQANVSAQQVSAQQGQASASKGQQSLALQQQYMGQQGNQHASPAKGLAPECWSPINLQEAVDRLYDSEEEATPRASVLGTVRRMFGRARSATPIPPPHTQQQQQQQAPATTARQLHEMFGTPAPSPPRCTPDPAEAATVDGEQSVSALRRRCKRLMAERDDARAEGYAEAALAVEQGMQIDRLRRAKDMLLARLHTTERQLLATFRDEASTDLIRALAAARVEAAEREFAAMELQGQLRRRGAVIDKLRAQLTRLEYKYRASINAMSPGAKGPPPSPFASSPSPLQLPPAPAAASPLAAAAADGGAGALGAAALTEAGAEAEGTLQQQQRQRGRSRGSNGGGSQAEAGWQEGKEALTARPLQLQLATH